MIKKVLIWSLIVLAVLILILAGYYLLINKQNSVDQNNPSDFQKFQPIGGSGGNNGTSTDNTKSSGIQNNSAFTSKLRKLWGSPVSGAGVVDSKAGSTVRFMDMATGHIYDSELFSPVQSRISNLTIPMIKNAFWSSNNTNAVIQTLNADNDNFTSYSLNIKNSSSTPIKGLIFSLSARNFSTYKTKIFYLEDGGNSSVGYLANIDGGNKKQIWSSEIRDFIPQFVNDNTIILTTKPYPNILGYSYKLNTNTGASQKILGGVYGLTTLMSPDESKIIYNSQTDQNKLYVYSVASKSSTEISPNTFPEKCVWSKQKKDTLYCAVPNNAKTGDSLTNWYIGGISFADEIWKYDIKNNTSTMVADLSKLSGESIDVLKPILSDSDQYLIFLNKIDSSLWSLDLTK